MTRTNSDSVGLQGLYIEVRNKNVDKALKILKKKVKESKVLHEYINNMHYIKPSVLRRRKKYIAKEKMKKIQNEKNF